MHFKNFEPAKNLGIPGVYSMFQDTTGIMWLGNNNGLFRYTGTDIFEFNAAEKKLLGKLNFSFLQDAASSSASGAGCRAVVNSWACFFLFAGKCESVNNMAVSE